MFLKLTISEINNSEINNYLIQIAFPNSKRKELCKKEIISSKINSFKTYIN